MLPSSAAFRNPVVDDDESCERVGPPPAEEGIPCDAEQNGTRQRPVDEGDTRLRGEHWIAQSAAGDQLSPGQEQHDGAGHCKPDDRRLRCSWMCAGQERPTGLRKNVDRQRDECRANELESYALAISIDTLELPDHDDGGENLDRPIEAEAAERRRRRLRSGEMTIVSPTVQPRIACSSQRLRQRRSGADMLRGWPSLAPGLGASAQSAIVDLNQTSLPGSGAPRLLPPIGVLAAAARLFRRKPIRPLAEC